MMKRQLANAVNINDDERENVFLFLKGMLKIGEPPSKKDVEELSRETRVPAGEIENFVEEYRRNNRSKKLKLKKFIGGTR